MPDQQSLCYWFETYTWPTSRESAILITPVKVSFEKSSVFRTTKPLQLSLAGAISICWSRRPILKKAVIDRPDLQRGCPKSLVHGCEHHRQYTHRRLAFDTSFPVRRLLSINPNKIFEQTCVGLQTFGIVFEWPAVRIWQAVCSRRNRYHFSVKHRL